MEAPMVKAMENTVILICIFLVQIHTSSPIKKNLFGTKTAYEWARVNNHTVVENDFHDILVNSQTCFPIHIASLMRHGARFPGSKDIKKLTKFHNAIKSEISRKHFPTLRQWVNPFSADEEKLLSKLGEREQYELGQRYAQRWKALLQPAKNSLSFITSTKQRSRVSAANFYDGLMENLSDVEKDDFESDTNNDLLRFHEACGRFVHSVDRNKSSLHEVSKFKNGNMMRNIASFVAVKLGISTNLVDTGLVKVMYIYCAVEMGLYGKSQWCNIFENGDLEVLEYFTDLKQYWKKAYGYSINHEQSCPLLQDIFHTMDKVINPELSPTVPVGKFYFGHAETLFPLITALGLFNETTPLLANNYEQHINRVFRSSQIMPFSANIAFVLYKCDNDSPSEITVDGVDYDGSYVIKYFMNEQEIQIPGCDDVVCPYAYLRKRHSRNIDNCDFTERCKVESQTENKHKDEL